MHREPSAPGFVDLVRAQLNSEAFFPVHRLDKMTSGLLILARDAQANSLLSASFRERQVEKYYLAIGAGKPTKKQGLICGDMARSRRATWKLCQTQNNPAVTQFFSGGFAPGLRWFLLKPATGKTHQLRVALKSLGTPVLGDPLYGTHSDEAVDRGYLHAWALRFALEGEEFSLLSPPTEGQLFQQAEFRAALDSLTPPWEQLWPKLPGALLQAIGRNRDDED